jgi:hypothetical protein
MLHPLTESADVLPMEAHDAYVVEIGLDEQAESPEVVGEIDGDHPDPVTLCEPGYDSQGLLRWASMPFPGRVG